MKNSKNSKIDFVILWVDGNDKNWIKEKNIYQTDKNIVQQARFRDWDNLQYWFRGIEKFAPWVNNIFFITYGHTPTWLNIKHPKLKIIKHEDFIPRKYLPTFNSNVIELNLKNIKELSEQFVLFNDDMFIIKKMKSKDFFKKGLPCEIFVEDINAPIHNKDEFANVITNNMKIINNYFEKRKIIKESFFKIFNYRYGMNIFRNVLLLPWSRFSNIKCLHLPVSILKSTIKELWELEYNKFDETCNTKFRNETNINQYLFRCWQLMKGDFYPRSYRIGKMYNISENNNEFLKAIIHQKYKMICLNDRNNGKRFRKKQKRNK